MEDKITVEPRRFEIKVYRHERGRKPWTYRWHELNIDRMLMSYDPFYDCRFKSADAAYAAAVDEIYRTLAKEKHNEVFTHKNIITVP